MTPDEYRDGVLAAFRISTLNMTGLLKTRLPRESTERQQRSKNMPSNSPLISLILHLRMV